MILFECWIPERAIVKKNTAKFYNKKKVYSPLFRKWEQLALILIKRSFSGETLDTPLELKIDFYFENKQAEADLSNLLEGPADALTKAGVIKDDRLIQVIEARKHFYCENVGTKIELRSIE